MPSPNNKRRTIILISLGLVLVAGYIAISILVAHNKKNAATINEGLYYDPVSGETISNPSGKSPEKYGQTNTDQPIFLGTAKLLEIGVSESQIDDFKAAIYQFSKQNAKAYTEVSVAVKTIALANSTDGANNVITFGIVANRKDSYNIELSYSIFSALTVKVMSTSGQLLFTSQN